MTPHMTQLGYTAGPLLQSRGYVPSRLPSEAVLWDASGLADKYKSLLAHRYKGRRAAPRRPKPRRATFSLVLSRPFPVYLFPFQTPWFLTVWAPCWPPQVTHFIQGLCPTSLACPQHRAQGWAKSPHPKAGSTRHGTEAGSGCPRRETLWVTAISGLSTSHTHWPWWCQRHLLSCPSRLRNTKEEASR